MVLALSLLASAAEAQVLDWKGSGGDLFWARSGTLPEPEPEPEPEPVPEAGPGPEFASTAVAETRGTTIPAPPQPYQAEISAAARAHGLDPKLLHALVIAESGYRPGAVSSAGAGGLTQLMPGTARDLGVFNRFDPVANLFGGADYLAQQILRFGDIRLALAAYHAGPARVARAGRVPSIPQTEHYVLTVIDCFLALTAGRSINSARECTSPADRR